MSKKEMNELFKQYIEVCNKAIDANKDDFPFKQLWGMGGKMFENYEVHMAIYDDRPQDIHVLRFKDYEFKEDTKAKPNEKKAWGVNYSYLKKVVDNPEEYIKHPTKLDWDWLKSKL